jgi:hypothetical protein
MLHHVWEGKTLLIMLKIGDLAGFPFNFVCPKTIWAKRRSRFQPLNTIPQIGWAERKVGRTMRKDGGKE